LLHLSAGYVQRSIELFPHQGSHDPWTVEMSYAADRALLRNLADQTRLGQLARTQPDLLH
jgi:hypothetical protein